MRWTTRRRSQAPASVWARLTGRANSVGERVLSSTKETPFNGCQHGNWSGHHRLLPRPRQQIIKIRDIAVGFATARARSVGILQIFLGGGRAGACRERGLLGGSAHGRCGRVFVGGFGGESAEQVMNPVERCPWSLSPRHGQGEVGAGAALPRVCLPNTGPWC